MDKKNVLCLRLALFLGVCAAVATPASAVDAPELPTGPVLAAAGESPSSPDATLFETRAAALPKTPSQNVTINLIRRLVQRGVLTEADASELIKQAEEDADLARAQAAAVQQDAAAAREQANAAVQTATAAAAIPPLPEADDAVRVTYVPEVVKQQMRDEIKQEVLNQAREENWAAPRTFPTWVESVRLFGDLRTRYEGLFYPPGNDTSGAFTNFNAINTGSPFDANYAVTGAPPPPDLNVDQDRTRFRIRARAGMAVDLGENFTAGMRVASGESNSPVSTNQSLGYAGSGQGGNFSKYAVWLDRAFIKYQLTGRADSDLIASVGRFDNPFFCPTPIVWDDDMGMDGVAVHAKYQAAPGFKPFITGGAFPVFNTDLNFATYSPAKYSSYDKYLYGGQIGADWKIRKDLSSKIAVAYYYFQNVAGQLSNPIPQALMATNSTYSGNTDASRPSFAQKGNTYRPLRLIVPDPTLPASQQHLYQYYGLATPFRDLAVTARLDYSRFDPFQISLTGEFVKNLAFNSSNINAVAVNNLGPVGFGSYVGGDTAWVVQLKVGKPVLEKRWDWNAGIGYRHVESDAVIDGFTDSDFGGGGTNLKGFTIGCTLALSKSVYIGLNWLSADSIAGPTYKNDIIQFDVGAKF